MKRLLLTITLCFFMLFTFLSAQQFNLPVSQPYGLVLVDTPATSAGLVFADMDGDGDDDALHTASNDDGFFLSLQLNNGTATSPNFEPHQTIDLGAAFPNIMFFGDVADINADGKPDIIGFGELVPVSGFALVYYMNTSVGGVYSFERTRADSIGIPAVGDGLFFPEFVDLNQDGDIDVLMAGGLYDQAQDDYDGTFLYAQNNGNLTDPTYTGWYENAYDLFFSDTFQFGFTASADLDLDGDIDILTEIGINNDEAYFYYFENIAEAGMSPLFSTPILTPFNLPDTTIGFPQFNDIDGDGDSDLFVYDLNNSQILFFENTYCYSDSAFISTGICDGETVVVGASTYTASGNYIDVLQNIEGCDSTVLLELTVTEINTGISQTDITLTSDQVGASYQWIDCDANVDISGATERTYMPKTTGTYAVRVVIGNCEELSSCVLFLLSGTESLASLGIEVYPNPVHDKLYLVGLSKLGGLLNIALFDANGRLLKIEWKEGEVLDVSGYNTGPYTLTFEHKGVRYSHAFVKAN